MNRSGLLSRRRLLAGLGAGGALLAAGGLDGCTRLFTPAAGPDAAPAGSAFAEPAELTSRDGRLEVTLTASATAVPYGSGTRWALTYNGSTPGPTLRVRPGDELVVTLDNRFDATTNLHTHGLHVSPEGDSDNVFVMVEPGQSHTYRYRIPTDHPSGTFWYHPHHHGQVAPQLSGGLAGAIIVEDHLDQLPALAGATSRLLVLSDPTIGDTASVLDASAMQQMLGREGDAILINGLPRPTLHASSGTVEHWRIVNASPSKFYGMRLDGLPLHLIAGDGSRLPTPTTVDEVVLVPGERAEILIPLTAAGTHALTTRAVDRGGMGMGMAGGSGMGGSGMGPMGGGSRGRTDKTTTAIATLEITGERQDAPDLPTSLRADDSPPDAVTTRRDLTLSMGMGMAGEFRIDGRTFDPDRVDITTRVGTTEEWTIHNTSTMDHPFHLHVWPFRVVERSDGAAVPAGWKDTVNVPAGQWVRIRIPFRDHTGRTVYHCHIVDHEDLGMMGTIETSP